MADRVVMLFMVGRLTSVRHHNTHDQEIQSALALLAAVTLLIGSIAQKVYSVGFTSIANQRQNSVAF